VRAPLQAPPSFIMRGTAAASPALAPPWTGLTPAGAAAAQLPAPRGYAPWCAPWQCEAAALPLPLGPLAGPQPPLVPTGQPHAPAVVHLAPSQLLGALKQQVAALVHGGGVDAVTLFLAGVMRGAAEPGLAGCLQQATAVEAGEGGLPPLTPAAGYGVARELSGLQQGVPSAAAAGWWAGQQPSAADAAAQ
jgi:hypothetical protein